ncbi:MAG TPA: hypothetical protein VJ574_08685 [Candidatus Bathyarchaeia archaeon]|nr:hypothetical protein [Candidatus Bathyarchaeia archaeon]
MENSQERVVATERCDKCGYSIDQCQCVCPYCGETTLCTCCIGYGRAMGG